MGFKENNFPEDFLMIYLKHSVAESITEAKKNKKVQELIKSLAGERGCPRVQET